MYLKSVQILGFKTFADKTRIEFGRGVSAIIGPNGCGKSNIVDAIKWALGEQSVKSLRGGEMADVIFNGGARRRSAPFAEVTLLIDNEDRKLAVDSVEVSLRRRLHANGTSEYFLNEAPCRLKDFRELFMDTGVGAKTHAVIEQRQLTRLIDASSKERKLMLEEAAEVSRFRQQRAESSAKLERMQENLDRSKDVLDLEEKHRRSLAEKASRALRFERLRKDLQRARLDLGAIELHGWIGKRLELDRGREDRGSRQEELRRLAAARAAELVAVEGRERELEDEMARYQEENAAFTRAYTESEHTVQHHGRRITELSEELAVMEEERARFAAELEETKLKIAACREDEDGCQRMIGLDGQLKVLEEENARLEARIAERKAVFLRQKDREIEKVRQRALRQNEVTRGESALEFENRRLREIDERAADTEAKLAAMQGRQDQDGEAKAAMARLKELFRRKEEGVARVRQIRERLKALELELRRIVSEDSGLRSRLQALHENEAALHGVGGGVRAILEVYRRMAPDGSAHPRGIHGLVADLLTVPQDYLEAIEAALGPRMQNLVTGSAEDAKQAINFLRERKAGRATFLPLDRLQGRAPLSRGLLNQPGVRGEAYNLVGFDPVYTTLVSYLLHGVLVVENLDVALRIGKEHRIRLVTLLGDIVLPDGAMAGGGKGGEIGLISRKAEIAVLEEQLAGKERERAVREREHEDGLNEEERVQVELKRVDTLVEEAQHGAKTHEQRAMLDEKEFLRLNNERILLQQERAQAAERIAAAAQVLEEKRGSLANLDAEFNMAATEDIRPEDLAHMESEQGALESRIQDMKLERMSLNDQSQSMARERGYLETRARDLEERLERRRRMTSDKGAERDRLQAEHDAAKEVLDRLQGDYKSQQARFFQMKEEREGLRQRRGVLQEDARSGEESARGLDKELTDLAVEDARLSEKQQQLFYRMHEEYHIDFEEQYLSRRKAGDELFQKEAEFPALEGQLRESIAELERKIQGIGSVDMEAVEELKVQEEKVAALKEQLNDLQESHGKMDDVIKDLDRQCNERFMATFHSVNVHFQDMFARLFGGGRGHLEIEQGVDPIDAGVTISATPPGKSPRVISQLSGGEMVLTTIAFLFAIFLDKPSPFCVLDEIDAPLDEHNVDRFMAAIRGFTGLCQFIIVTHNRRTMSLSDRIHGVTMQESGVSRCLSVDMGSVEFDRIMGEIDHQNAKKG